MRQRSTFIPTIAHALGAIMGRSNSPARFAEGMKSSALGQQLWLLAQKALYSSKDSSQITSIIGASSKPSKQMQLDEAAEEDTEMLRFSDEDSEFDLFESLDYESNNDDDVLSLGSDVMSENTGQWPYERLGCPVDGRAFDDDILLDHVVVDDIQIPHEDQYLLEI